MLQALRLAILLLFLLPAQRSAANACDFYCYLAAANEASLVMLAERGIVDDALAGRIARGIDQVMLAADADPTLRSSNYLDFERQLLAIAGEEASQVHLGRSRQDLHGTVRRMLVRDGFLATFEGLLDAREALLLLAETNADIVIPAYTHGVQAQPTSAGHYLLAFSAAFERDAERMREAYGRLNRSPLGAAALGTSGFPVDRNRLAMLLGFEAPVENSYDANLISSCDFMLELAAVLSLSAVPIGQLAENLHTQYHNVVPWFVLDAAMTSGSSIMPQKRNPRPIDRLRTSASRVVGDSQTLLLTAHNTNTGMHDYRVLSPIRELLAQARDMYLRYASVVGGMRISRDRALEELNRGYSTTTEIADVLSRTEGIPFRLAHHYASELTTWCLQRGRALIDLTDDELQALYQEANGEPLPVSVDIVRAAMDPERMVARRQGLGGPQPGEVQRMLSVHRSQARAHRAWLDDARGALSDSAKERRNAFESLERGF